MCDNPECDKARMVTKEGDELGIEPIRERIERCGDSDRIVRIRISDLARLLKPYVPTGNVFTGNVDGLPTDLKYIVDGKMVNKL